MRIVSDLPADVPQPAFAYAVKCWLEGIATGIAPLMHYWQIPPLYQSGVVYRLEPGHGSGVEHFDLPLDCLKRGDVDCDDAVIWRCAELIAADIPATVRAEWVGGELHVLVRLPDGRTEDPSKILAEKEGLPWPSP